MPSFVEFHTSQLLNERKEFTKDIKHKDSGHVYLGTVNGGVLRDASGSWEYTAWFPVNTEILEAHVVIPLHSRSEPLEVLYCSALAI